MSSYLTNLIARTFGPADGLRPASTSLARSAATASSTFREGTAFAERSDESSRPDPSHSTRSMDAFGDGESWPGAEMSVEARSATAGPTHLPGRGAMVSKSVPRAASGPWSGPLESDAQFALKEGGVARSPVEQEGGRAADGEGRFTAGAPGRGETARSPSVDPPVAAVGDVAAKGLEIANAEVLAMEDGGVVGPRSAGERRRRETRAAGDQPTDDGRMADRTQRGEFMTDERDPDATGGRHLGEAFGRAAQLGGSTSSVGAGLRPAASRREVHAVAAGEDWLPVMDEREIGRPWAERGQVEGAPTDLRRLEARLGDHWGAGDRESVGTSEGQAGAPIATTRSRALAPAVERQGERAEPTVHITIGRLEVRGSAAAAAPAQRPSKPTTPVASLEEYLRGRNRGQRRE